MPIKVPQIGIKMLMINVKLSLLQGLNKGESFNVHIVNILKLIFNVIIFNCINVFLINEHIFNISAWMPYP